MASNPCNAPGTPRRWQVGARRLQGERGEQPRRLVASATAPGHAVRRSRRGPAAGTLWRTVAFPGSRARHSGRQHGNNVLNRQYDQRGAGHPRIRDGRAGVGAYEGATANPSPPGVSSTQSWPQLRARGPPKTRHRPRARGKNEPSGRHVTLRRPVQTSRVDRLAGPLRCALRTSRSAGARSSARG